MAEEANTESLALTRKGIDKALNVVNIDLLQEAAAKNYSEGVRAFVFNGSGRQWTLNENQRAWGDWAFTPHRMNAIVREKIDLSVDLLGLKLPHPFIVTPFGSHALHHPLGEIATVRGAGKSGGLACVSSASTASMEDIAKATPGPKWFQIYLDVDSGRSREMLQRARAAGYKAIILTVDAIGQGSSDEYVRLGKSRPWLPYGNYPPGQSTRFKTDLSWKDVEMIRQVTGLPVIVKGITRAEDAVAAVKADASAVQVSNHGGRALDGTPASITVLPAIADALKGDVPIILDSGIRRGTDVVKALALGANAVAIGRPVMYGLNLGGASGVDSVLAYFRNETVDTTLHCGVDALAKLGKAHVRHVGRRPRRRVHRPPARRSGTLTRSGPRCPFESALHDLPHLRGHRGDHHPPEAGGLCLSHRPRHPHRQRLAVPQRQRKREVHEPAQALHHLRAGRLRPRTSRRCALAGPSGGVGVRTCRRARGLRGRAAGVRPHRHAAAELKFRPQRPMRTKVPPSCRRHGAGRPRTHCFLSHPCSGVVVDPCCAPRPVSC